MKCRISEVLADSVVVSAVAALFCVLLWAPVCTAEKQNTLPTPEVIQHRRAIAESGEFSHQTQLFQAAAVAEPSELVGALDLDASFVVPGGVTLTGPTPAAGVFAGLGVIEPRRGSTLALLSSGIAGTSAPEPGIDFPPAGPPEGDKVTLSISLDIPEGVNRLGFNYNFLSSEFPDFIGTIFNDTFTAVLTDAGGTREIARESVNGSSFFAASASQAGGSGFDIFTEDPSGVDTEFGTGLPDAGLTGYKTVSVEVQGGAPVTLEFSIEDRGDGILDSAVVLDNLMLASLEAVDPNPTFLSDGQIIFDPETLSQGGEPVQGAAADGVTRVLLRNSVSGPGMVEFCIVDASAPEDGGLDLVGGTGRADCVIAPVDQTSQGFVAFAVYRTPDEFNRVGDEGLAKRPLGFRATFMPQAGEHVVSEIPFHLVRPPVVLVHGLWSSPDTWTFPLFTDSRYSVTLADYRSTNASHFATNLLVPFTYTNEALARLRLFENTATTQVDIAGHSMGGILSRNHTGLGFYERSENYNAGDLHKLVTLNTPHAGSPVANFVNVIRAIPIVGGLFESAAQAVGHPVHLGALDDLAVGSAAIDAIQETTVPGHALVGIGGATALEFAPGKLGAFYTVVNFFADTSELLQGVQHDFVVGRQSQEGGMPNSAFTVFDGFDSIHTSVTGSNNYSNRLVELLNSRADGVLFADFPAPTLLSAFSPLTTEGSAVLEGTTAAAQMAQGNELQIIEPPDGMEVVPGNTVSVVVEPEVGVDVNTVLIVGPAVALVDEVAPFEFELTVPVEAIGTFNIAATGTDGLGNFFSSNTVTLQVVPTAALESVTLLSRDPILFDVGETRSLTVVASYADDVRRNITDPSAGTEYLSSDSGIVKVSADGFITATAPGVATVIARNGGAQDSVSVTVLSVNEAPTADAGEDSTVFVGDLVNLDGSKSFDPDDGPEELKFEWFQVAGPQQVVLLNPTTPSPSFTPAVGGTYVFSLVVRDGLADSAPDNVTVSVVANQPPVADAGPDQGVECAGSNGAQVMLDGSGSSDPDGDPLTYTWTGPFGELTGGTATTSLPLGTHTITLTLDDGNGGIDADTVEVTVQDTVSPSVDVMVTPEMLWPVNHKMVPIDATVTANDVCDATPVIALQTVIANEGDNALGDGNTLNDIVIGNDGAISLRAERSGKGVGRVYTISYIATDASGNTSTASATVTVPHDKRK